MTPLPPSPFLTHNHHQYDSAGQYDQADGIGVGEHSFPFPVNTAVTEAFAPREKVSGKTTNRELLAPRLCRESGGVTPTAQMTRADGRKRDEVQVSAPSTEEGGKPSANSVFPSGGIATATAKSPNRSVAVADNSLAVPEFLRRARA